MTDIEILRTAGLIPYLHGTDRTAVLKATLKAMAQARADERVQVGSDIQVACTNGDFPIACEDMVDFVVMGK